VLAELGRGLRRERLADVRNLVEPTRPRITLPVAATYVKELDPGGVYTK